MGGGMGNGEWGMEGAGGRVIGSDWARRGGESGLGCPLSAVGCPWRWLCGHAGRVTLPLNCFNRSPTGGRAGARPSRFAGAA